MPRRNDSDPAMKPHVGWRRPSQAAAGPSFGEGPLIGGPWAVVGERPDRSTLLLATAGSKLLAWQKMTALALHVEGYAELRLERIKR